MRWYKIPVVGIMWKKMFIGFSCYFDFFRSHKKYYVYMIALLSLFIVCQFQTSPFLIQKKMDLQLIKATESGSHSSSSLMIYQYKPKIIEESYNYSHLAACGKHNRPADNSVRKNELVNSISIVLQSRSLMYCPVPKVATKTLLTVILYMHVRDISEHLDNNWTNIDTARARTEQMIDIPAFIENLRQV
jgi:hypothetical protein